MTHLGVKIARKGNLVLSLVYFLRFVFKVHFSLILAEFRDQNGSVFGGVDMLEVW